MRDRAKPVGSQNIEVARLPVYIGLFQHLLLHAKPKHGCSSHAGRSVRPFNPVRRGSILREKTHAQFPDLAPLDMTGSGKIVEYQRKF